MGWEVDWAFAWWSCFGGCCLVWMGVLIERPQYGEFLRIYFVTLYCLMGIVHKKKKVTSRS